MGKDRVRSMDMQLLEIGADSYSWNNNHATFTVNLEQWRTVLSRDESSEKEVIQNPAIGHEFHHPDSISSDSY